MTQAHRRALLLLIAVTRQNERVGSAASGVLMAMAMLASARYARLWWVTRNEQQALNKRT